MARAGRAILALAVLLAASSCAREARPSSLLLVVVDTLRADRLGVYGYERDTSPHLDRRAEEAVVFERAYSTSSWTLPAMASLLTGRLPAEHGARKLPGEPAADRETDEVLHHGKRFSPLTATVPTLAERLARRGLATCAMVTNPFLEERFGLARGFERYDYMPRRAGAAVVEEAVTWLEARHTGDEPFFLMLHVLEPHLPYAPEPPERGRFSAGEGSTLSYPVNGVHALRRRLPELDERDRTFLGDAYDEEIATVDRQLAPLFEALDRLGAWEDTLVVFTSDHGEELFEHDGFEHGVTMFDETIRVPLIAWGPGLEPKRSDRIVSIADIAVTALEALGAEARDIPGTRLWSWLSGTGGPRPQPVFASGALHADPIAAGVAWPWKAVAEAGVREGRVFDLARDPAELHPVASPPSEAVRLLAVARRLAEQETSTDGADVELDEATADGLRDLGYIE